MSSTCCDTLKAKVSQVGSKTQTIEFKEGTTVAEVVEMAGISRDSAGLSVRRNKVRVGLNDIVGNNDTLKVATDIKGNG